MNDKPEYVNPEINLSVLQEELNVQKHTRVTGVVRLNKRVRTVETGASTKSSARSDWSKRGSGLWGDMKGAVRHGWNQVYRSSTANA